MANFVINCPSCQRQLLLPEELHGRQVRCPHCEHTYTAQGPEQGVPPPPESIRPAPDPERPWTPPREQEYDRPSRREEEEDDDYEEARWYRREGRYSQRDALNAVSGPAIALLVTGWISIVISVLLVCLSIATFAAGGAGANKQNFRGGLIEGALGIPMHLFGLVLAILIVFGATKMRRLESYGMAMAASIIAMIPCYGYFCCILGVPFGIWSIVVLSKPEVKELFH
jgi:hypothetical protein